MQAPFNLFVTLLCLEDSLTGALTLYVIINTFYKSPLGLALFLLFSFFYLLIPASKPSLFLCFNWCLKLKVFHNFLIQYDQRWKHI